MKFLALIFFFGKAWALQPVANEFTQDKTWNKDTLAKIYALGDSRVSIQEIENFKPLTTIYYRESVGEVIVEPTESFTNMCVVFGADARKKTNEWTSHESYLFRYPARGLRSYFHGSPEALQMISKLPYGLVYSGGQLPATSELSNIMEIVKTQEIPGRGLQFSVRENNKGLFGDMSAPLTLTFRKYKGNLLGQFKNKSGEVTGYKLCYNAERTFCYAKGSYVEVSRQKKSSVEHGMALADGGTLKEARENLLARMHRVFDCDTGNDVYGWDPAGDMKAVARFCRENHRDDPADIECHNQIRKCQAMHAAAARMTCGDDLAKLPLQVVRSNENGTSTILKPMFYE